jgi:hypothetical protein
MNLYQKIISIYPELANSEDFTNGTIMLQDDGDGAYIKEWNASMPMPTKKELDSIK